MKVVTHCIEFPRMLISYIATTVYLIPVLLPLSTQDMTESARLFFHGDGYNRWFDKSVQIIVTDTGIIGANVEHSVLDATVCGQMWEYALSSEGYTEDGHVLEYGEMPPSTPTPTV